MMETKELKQAKHHLNLKMINLGILISLYLKVMYLGWSMIMISVLGLDLDAPIPAYCKPT